MSGNTDIERQTDVAEKNLQRLLEWTGRYDTKCSLVLGIDTALIGSIPAFASPPQEWFWYTTLFTVVTLFMIAISFYNVCVGGTPQTHDPGRSLLFFGSIAKRTVAEYRQEFLSQTKQEYLDDLLQQCHRNSEILHDKFTHFQRGYTLLLYGLIPWFVCMLLYKYQGMVHK